MAARLLAALAAVAMVVGALYVRAGIDEDDERRSTTLRLVCSTELAAVCDALAGDPGTQVETTVEEAAATADRLVTLAPGRRAPLDGWLVAGPWPTIVAEARQRNGLAPLLSGGRVVARSPIVLVVWPDRAGVLEPRCQNGTPGWRCVGEVAGQPWTALGGDPRWGPVKPGHPPVATGAGLAVLGTATAAYFGRTDLSSADLEDTGYRTWLTTLERAVPNRPASPVEAMLVRGPAAFDAVGALEAEAGPLVAASARPDKPVLLYPSPVATADVVLGTPGTRASELLAELVGGTRGKRALAAAGWRVPGQARAPGVPATPLLPPDSGLPRPGVLDALRAVVNQAVR